MKKLFLLLLLITVNCMAQQQGNFQIPTNYIGTWINPESTDTIVITNTSITWTSNEPQPVVSFGDFIIHTDSQFFSFSAYPNAYILSLEKISHVKLNFLALTTDGYLRSNGTYFKQGTRQN